MTGLADGTDEQGKLTNLSRFPAPKKASVKALVHDFGCADEVIEEATDKIEDYFTRLSINRAYRGPDPAASLPDSIFNNLHPEDRRKWVTISSDSKKLIVRNEKPTASCERPSGRHQPR